MERTAEQIQNEVKQRYGAIARGEQSGCGCASAVDVALTIGYSPNDLQVGEGANLGLGCGNPLALAELRPGMKVLDLGSGAGFDAFLAWQKVGPQGRVIGVDMTDDMLARARANAAQLGAANVEFRKGFIEQLPLEDSSVDFVISNCVINLSPNKPAVFRDVYRVLKPGGRFAVSDIVLLKTLPTEVTNDVSAYVGCIAGASLMGDYVRLALEAGLRELTIPEIQYGSKLASVLAPASAAESGKTCCGSSAQLLDTASSAVASIKLHGKKL